MSLHSRSRGAQQARSSHVLRIVGLIASLSMVAGGLVALTVAPSASAVVPADSNNVTLKAQICHRDGGSGNWNLIEPSFRAVVNHKVPDSQIPEGHANANHQDGQDIIAPIVDHGFTYYDGKNWTPANQAFLERGCNDFVIKVTGVARCVVADATWTITWSVKNESANTSMKVKSTTPSGVIAGNTTIAAGATKTANQSGLGAGTKTLSVTADFGNGNNAKTVTGTGSVTIAGPCGSLNTVTRTAGPTDVLLGGDHRAVSGTRLRHMAAPPARSSRPRARGEDRGAHTGGRGPREQGPSGATLGACTSTKVTKTAGPTDYCSAGTTVPVSGTGTATYGNATRRVRRPSAEAEITAQTRADADLLAKVPRGATQGACTSGTVTRDAGPTDYCSAGTTVPVSGTGTATYGNAAGRSSPTGEAEVTAQQRADADLLSNARAARRRVPARRRTVTKTAGPTDYCSAGETVQLLGQRCGHLRNRWRVRDPRACRDRSAGPGRQGPPEQGA